MSVANKRVRVFCSNNEKFAPHLLGIRKLFPNFPLPKGEAMHELFPNFPLPEGEAMRERSKTTVNQQKNAQQKSTERFK